MMPPRPALHGPQGFALTELVVVLAILGLVMAGIMNVFMTGSTIALTGQNRAEAQQGARGALQMQEDLRMAGYGYPPALTAFTAASATAFTFWADLTNTSTTLTAAVNASDRTLNVATVLGVTVGDTVYLINQATEEALTVSGLGATSIGVSNPGAVNAYPVGTQVGRPRQITYSWDGASILSKNAGDGTGAQAAVTGVTAFTLTYFDANDNVIASPGTNLAAIRRIAMSLTVRSAATQNGSTFTINASGRPRNF
jgi:prepilin-type N-terminal cleavage/methylation domain-containing protein